MAKKSYTEEEPQVTATSISDEEVLAAGHDLAGYRQGEGDYAAHQAAIASNPDPAPEAPTNPYEAESNIGQSWQAGFDAGAPVIP